MHIPIGGTQKPAHEWNGLIAKTGLACRRVHGPCHAWGMPNAPLGNLRAWTVLPCVLYNTLYCNLRSRLLHAMWKLKAEILNHIPTSMGKWRSKNVWDLHSPHKVMSWSGLNYRLLGETDQQNPSWWVQTTTEDVQLNLSLERQEKGKKSSQTTKSQAPSSLVCVN